VVQVLGIYYPTPEAKLPWLVMEMMQWSLKVFSENSEKDNVPLPFKLSILVDISQGLEFLHGQDIVHRDLSSNNILLTKHCVAKIGDLGVAKVMEHNQMKTQTQTPGTLHFMPPEALLRKPRYGKPVDVFSLGCIACHVISHEWPEPKDRVPEGTMTVLTEIQRREEYLHSCSTASLKQLIESCLHNLPDQRPQISAVCRELKDLTASVNQQIPFATASNLELFNVVQKEKMENVELTNTLSNAEATIVVKNKLLQDGGKELQEKITELQEKVLEIQENKELLQSKDKEIQEMVKEIQKKEKIIEAKTNLLQEKDKLIQEMQNSMKDDFKGSKRKVWCIYYVDS